MAKQLSKKRLAHLISGSPTLQDKVIESNRREGASTILEKNFAGGVLFLTGANSASGLSSNPVKIIVADEVDRYPLSAGDEGSPLRLAEKRSTTFSESKIFILSTPVAMGKSVIQEELSNTDERVFKVPCPHCEHKQELVFDNLKWDKGKTETAKYACEGCGVLIEEKYKTQMLMNGEWIPTKPELSSPYVAGYRISSLYSPLGWMSWAEIAKQFLDDKDNPILLRTFINTVLGQPWEDRGEAPDWELLYERREPYQRNQPNNDVVMITVGADIQAGKDSRIELEVVGWCRDKTSYSLDYRVLYGDTTTPDQEVWAKLAEVVNEKWYRPDGVELPMMMMAVDSGNNTQTVYNWCRTQPSTKVVPVKGREQQSTIIGKPSTVDVSWMGKSFGSLKMWNVGVGVAKSEVYSLLRLGIDENGKRPIGYCHFPEYPIEYFKGITAEELKYRESHGFRKLYWEKVYDRNEPLDCRVYARAAAAIVGMDRFNDGHWDALIGKYKVKASETAPPKAQEKEPTKKKSSGYWDGYF
jgi:phage terminase large subunit GpA-like protein